MTLMFTYATFAPSGNGFGGCAGGCAAGACPAGAVGAGGWLAGGVVGFCCAGVSAGACANAAPALDTVKITPRAAITRNVFNALMYEMTFRL